MTAQWDCHSDNPEADPRTVACKFYGHNLDPFEGRGCLGCAYGPGLDGVYDNRDTFRRECWRKGKVWLAVEVRALERARDLAPAWFPLGARFGSYPDVPGIVKG